MDIGNGKMGTNQLSVHFQYSWGIVRTWLKIIHTLQVVGDAESSGAPLDDGHKHFLK